MKTPSLREFTTATFWYAVVAFLPGCAPATNLASVEPPKSFTQTATKNSKSLNPALDAKIDRLSNQLNDREIAIQSLLCKGQWAAVLAKLDEIEPRWGGVSAPPHSYFQERAEALIGLRRYGEAISVLDSLPPGSTAYPLTYDLARAELDQLEPKIALQHTRIALEAFCVEDVMPPPIAPPRSKAEIVACVRLARAVHLNDYEVAEREARAVLKGYPKQPIASYVLADSLRNRHRWQESGAYWEAAIVLPGPAGEFAKYNCHQLFPDRKEFTPPSPGPSIERSGPITPNLEREIDEQKAQIGSLRRKPR